ncbi:DNA ligase D [Virgibacillus halophilus]|uniref:DNA ligase D n=1 Tax=Tigheibacillus halophilus TaxID=361280 RepID=A0ABU5C4N8_9BACI|nr:DNA ligase D [Virgibacillus halophilus]
MKENHEQRRKKLLHVFQKLSLPTSRIQLVDSYRDAEALWKLIFDHKGEGLIAKRQKSVYAPGKNHHDWLKIKNWRIIHVILSSYQPSNDYFNAAVWRNDSLISIGKCKHGLDAEARQTVTKLFMESGSFNGQSYTLPPAIVAAVQTLDLYQGELREPAFSGIGAEAEPADCTLKTLQREQAMLPAAVDFSKFDKLYWPKAGIDKSAYLVYMREIAPYMLPFLREHLLTLIRCPEGVEEEYFFQKHLPEYAPSFIKPFQSEEETFMLCDSLESLLWFANHGGIEFHIPFEKAGCMYPNEIVFDLDPPNRERFDLAIKAATIIKKYLDKLKLSSFVKLSGNKGLQIHIPIMEKSMSYEQTALFTQAIAQTVENQHPAFFTTERMKKNRHGRLYIDYVQHGKNKTIIAPYSARKTEEGTVAVPLRWEEVEPSLEPQNFTIKNVVARVQNMGCPFANYELVRQQQNLKEVFTLLGESPPL